MYRFLRCTCSQPKDSSPYVPREQLKLDLCEQFHQRVWKNKSKYLATQLVVGPRGCGKTTIIQEVFEGHKSVVHVPLSNNVTIPEFESAFFDALDFKHLPEGLSRPTLIMGVLRILDKWKILPTLLLEVNAQCSTETLQVILTRLKEWGDDAKLMKSVVVLSSTRAAMTLNIGLNSLRVVCVSIPDLTEDEVQQFVMQMLSKYKDKRVAEVVEKNYLLVGNRLSELHELATKVEHCASLEKAESKIHEFVQKQRKRYVSSLEEVFTKIEQFQYLNEKSFHRDDLSLLIEMFKNNKQLNFSRFCQLVHMTRRDIIEMIANVHPHVFFVDPEDETVIVSSVFAQDALNSYKVK